MAGLVAAATNNDIGIAGVGYDGVSVLPIAVLGADGTGYDADIIDGLAAATAAGAEVVLMAFSSPYRSTALQTAIDAALAAGVVVVASVGNDGSTAASYPAGYPGVIGVAATDQADSLASFSNSGASAFIAAPGTDIVTLAPGGGTTSINGTSAAAAEVAGAAALLLAERRRTVRRGRPPLDHRRRAPLRPRPPRPRRRPRRPRLRQARPEVTSAAPSHRDPLYKVDASIGTYDQCSNDKGIGYSSGNTGCRWINSIVQKSNSLYFEGDATVQRLWLTDLRAEHRVQRDHRIQHEQDRQARLRLPDIVELVGGMDY